MVRMCISSVFLLFLVLNVGAVTSVDTSPSALSRRDAALIAEAYHLRQSLGDTVWPGWSKISIPFLYVTAEYEYAIDFPKKLSGFHIMDQDVLLGRPMQARKRTLSRDLSATFDFQDVDAVVMGTPEELTKSLGSWVLTATHEMFHVLQHTRGSNEKKGGLGIGSEGDASWNINFPFPYKDNDVMNLIHLQSYLVYLAVTNTSKEDLNYNARTAVETIRVYKNFLNKISSAEPHYKYSQLQEWSEGIAFYTEYKIAEAAATTTYKPLAEFRHLQGFTTYQKVWTDEYKNRLFLAKHAGRAARSRTAFYHVGLGKGLLLDRLMPDWKTRYFSPGVWINDLLMIAVGQPVEMAVLDVGTAMPDFTLRDISGAEFSLNQFRGRPVLIDFWEVWCPPCVEEIPHLKALQQKYRDQGLIVLGITSGTESENVALLTEVLRKHGLNYSTLLDERGKVGKLYNVSGYPHLFLLDRNGKLVYDKIGYLRGEEADIEKQIKKAVSPPDVQNQQK